MNIRPLTKTEKVLRFLILSFVVSLFTVLGIAIHSPAKNIEGGNDSFEKFVEQRSRYLGRAKFEILSIGHLPSDNESAVDLTLGYRDFTGDILISFGSPERIALKNTRRMIEDYCEDVLNRNPKKISTQFVGKPVVTERQISYYAYNTFPSTISQISVEGTVHVKGECK